jgi:hypothetical protein
MKAFRKFAVFTNRALKSTNQFLVENQNTRFVDFNAQLVNITNLFFECGYF